MRIVYGAQTGDEKNIFTRLAADTSCQMSFPKNDALLEGIHNDIMNMNVYEKLWNEKRVEKRKRWLKMRNSHIQRKLFDPKFKIHIECCINHGNLKYYNPASIHIHKNFILKF